MPVKVQWMKKRKRTIPNTVQGRITPVLKESEQHRIALANIAAYRQVMVARAGRAAGKVADDKISQGENGF